MNDSEDHPGRWPATEEWPQIDEEEEWPEGRIAYTFFMADILNVGNYILQLEQRVAQMEETVGALDAELRRMKGITDQILPELL